MAVSTNLASPLWVTRMPYGITQWCHPAEVRIPPFLPDEAGNRFSDPGGNQLDWVDLCYMKADRLGIEPATCQSQVQRPTAVPPRVTNRRRWPFCYNAYHCCRFALEWSRLGTVVCIRWIGGKSVVTRADGSGGGRVSTAACVFVFPHNISKTRCS